MSIITMCKQGNVETIPDCLEFYASCKKDQEAFVFVSEDYSREVVTWKDLYEKCRVTAKALVKLGVKKDEVVAIIIRNCPQWLYLTFGAMMAGARPVGISYRDRNDLIGTMEKLKTCSLLAMDRGDGNTNLDVVKGLVELQSNGRVTSSKMPYLRYLIALEQGENTEMLGVMHYSDFVEEVPDDIELPNIHEDDIAYLFQTSGSTGVPKLAAHTHKSMVCVREVIANGIFCISAEFNDHSLASSGGFPLNVPCGTRRVTLSGFCIKPNDPLKFLLEAVKQEKSRTFFLMPPLLHEFIVRQDELTFDWSVEVLITGGQPINKGTMKCIEKMAPMLVSDYSATEFHIGTFVSFSESNQFQKNLCGSVLDIPGVEMKVVDEKENSVPVNTKGEVWTRSPTVFKEYYNEPEKTAAVKTPDGWYKTGDVGWIDERGMLFVEGRKANVISSGEMPIIPETLERVLESHPAVSLSVVVPVQDEVGRNVLCACVLTNPKYDVTEQQLRSFTDESVSDKRVLPKYYMLLDEFPHLRTGKVDRKALLKKALMEFPVQ